MAAFCTIADIASFLQIAIDATNAAALRAIGEASAAIQNYCHQALEEIEGDEYTFDVGPNQTKLFLPELPPTEVSEVVENTETLVVDDDYKLGRDGILYRLGAYWYPGVQTVTVTYTHGYATMPDDIVGVCTRAASRVYQSGLRSAALAGVPGVQAQTIGDYSVQYASEQSGGSGGGGTLGASAAPMLLDGEKRMLDRYRLRGI